MGDIEIVIEKARRLESLLESKLGASGKGLHEKLDSVKSKVDPNYISLIRKIATIRNKTTHEDGFRHSDMGAFVRDCDRVADYLSKFGAPTSKSESASINTSKTQNQILDPVSPKKKQTKQIKKKAAPIQRHPVPEYSRPFSEDVRTFGRSIVWLVAGAILISAAGFGLFLGYQSWGVGGSILWGIISGLIGYLMFLLIKQIGYELVNALIRYFKFIVVTVILVLAIVYFWNVKVVNSDAVRRDATRFVSDQPVAMGNNVKSAKTIGSESLAETNFKTIDTGRLRSMTVDNAYRLEGGRKIKFMIIDTRTKEEYNEAHIFSAISIPVKDFEKLMDILPPDKSTLLVVYCNGTESETSRRWADKATAAGYKNVLIYLEGFSIWKEERMPMASL